MASRRMVDPAIWQSEDFASFTFRQRVLFIGLFSNADDQGRMPAHPALIRSTVFPYDDIPLSEIQADLDAIADAHCIELYAPDGKATLQILNWWKYQNPQWAYPSKIPPPADWVDRLRYRRDQSIVTQDWQTPGGRRVPDGVAEPLPKALPKALPKDLPGAIELGLELGLEIDTDQESGASAPSADADIPSSAFSSTFQGWQTQIEQAKGRRGGRQAIVHEMIGALYPGLDPPDYGYIVKAAKRMGGFGILAEWLWRCNTLNVKGDVLAYVQAARKNGKNGESSVDQWNRVIKELEEEEQNANISG